MNIVYNILVVIAVLVAIAFSLLVLVTGKGDAMGGGGSVRTTFKGKASFDDIMSKWTLAMGVSFMALILVVDVVAKRLDTANALQTYNPGASESGGSAPAPTLPASNAPTTPAPSSSLPGVPPITATPTNTPADAPGAVGIAPPTTNAPLDSSPSGSSATGSPSEPTIVPSLPTGTTAGGAANAAPPAGNR